MKGVNELIFCDVIPHSLVYSTTNYLLQAWNHRP